MMNRNHRWPYNAPTKPCSFNSSLI
jgi:hypothetical protein